MAGSKTIGFRLEEKQAEQLAALATAQGTSPGDYARSLVLAAIENTKAQEIQDALQNLRGELEALRSEVQARDTAAALRALREEIAQLATGAGSLSPDEPSAAAAQSIPEDLHAVRQSIETLAAHSHQAQAPASGEISTLRKSMDALTAALRKPPTPAGVDALRKSMDALTHALAHFQAPSTQEIAALRDSVEDLTDALGTSPIPTSNDALTDTVKELRVDLATAVVALLVAAREQSVEDDNEADEWEKQARSWVKQHLQS